MPRRRDFDAPFDDAEPQAAREGQPLTQSSDPKSAGFDAEFRLYLLKKIVLVRVEADFPDLSDLYVEISNGEAPMLVRLNAATFHDHLNRLVDTFAHGAPEAVISRSGFHDIQEFLSAKAHRIARTRPVFKRVAWLPEDGELWIDLSRDDGLCVRITSTGWNLDVPLAPLFVRFPMQRSLPLPESCDDGHAAYLRILPPGISAEDAKLLLGAILGCLIPSSFNASFSYPTIIITGEAGSGKSTLAKTLKRLIDNELATVAAKPTRLDDLYVDAQDTHLLSYDNVDFIKGSLSDALCQLTTASAVKKRKFYTDADKLLLRAHNPILLNGIHPDIPRQDFLDRSISIHLSRITHLAPDAVNRTEADLPLVMGYICDLLARALANYATTTLAQPTRLSLLAKLATAAEPFGCATPFAELLAANQRDALIATQDNNLVIAALFELLAADQVWTGTYKRLLTALTNRADEATSRSPEWPASPHRLANLMRNHARLLREQGLEITAGAKTEHGRMVTIRRIAMRGTVDDEIPF
jgi:hypothetical protein